MIAPIQKVVWCDSHEDCRKNPETLAYACFISRHAFCQCCGIQFHLTKKGLVSKHGHGRKNSCRGGGRLPLPNLDAFYELFREGRDEFLALEPKDTGYYNRVRTNYDFPAYCRRFVSLSKHVLPSVSQEELQKEYAWLESMFRALGEILWFSQTWQDYGHCRICRKEQEPAVYERALRRIEKPACRACEDKETKRLYACCDRAEVHPCVCVRSYRCPEHGDIHHGSHD